MTDCFEDVYKVGPDLDLEIEICKGKCVALGPDLDEESEEMTDDKSDCDEGSHEFALECTQSGGGDSSCNMLQNVVFNSGLGTGPIDNGEGSSNENNGEVLLLDDPILESILFSGTIL